MGFAALTVVMLAALLGPLLAVGSRWHVPVVVGEVLVGVACSAGPAWATSTRPTTGSPSSPRSGSPW